MDTQNFNWDESNELTENEKLVASINNGEFEFKSIQSSGEQNLEQPDPAIVAKVKTKVLERSGMTWSQYRDFEKNQLTNFFNDEFRLPPPDLFSRSESVESSRFLNKLRLNDNKEPESAADRAIEEVVNKLERSAIQNAFEVRREAIFERFHRQILINKDRVKTLSDALQDLLSNYHTASHYFDNAQKKLFEAAVKHDDAKFALQSVYQPQGVVNPALILEYSQLDRSIKSAAHTLKQYYAESTRLSAEEGTQSHLESARKKHIEELTEARAVSKQSFNPQTGELQTYKIPSWRDLIASKIESIGAHLIADKIRGTIESAIVEIAEKSSYIERQNNLKDATNKSEDPDEKMRLDAQRNFEQMLRDLDKYKQTKLVAGDMGMEFLEEKIRQYEYQLNEYVKKIADADIELSSKKKRLIVERNKLSFKSKVHPMHAEIQVRLKVISKKAITEINTVSSEKHVKIKL